MPRKDGKSIQETGSELSEQELERAQGGTSLAGEVVQQENIVAPRDLASGMPTGKRQ
jgi:hypothetical protein